MGIVHRAAASLALACVLAADPASAADPGAEEPASPFALRPEVEIPVLVAASAVWALPALFQDELAPGRCAPCDPGGVNAFDRTVIGLDDERARVASDVGLVAVPALAGAGALLDVAPFGWSAALEDAVLVAESIAISGAVTGVVKNMATRPRPYMYDAELAERHGTSRGNFLSFYSGHTSLAFSAAVSFATVFTFRRPDDPWRYAVWGIGVAAASAVGVCRVLAGVHFWTDVIAGAVAGGAFGALVPVLHLRRGRGRPAVEASAIAGPGGAAVFVRF
jgi:membrane-associated phospholipid phosphatase